MAAEQLPVWFFPAFFTAFAVNVAYLACVYGLQARLQAVATRTGGTAPFNLFGGSFDRLFKLLGFVYSERHAALNDSLTTALTWAVRVLFVVGLVGTLGVFALFAVML